MVGHARPSFFAGCLAGLRPHRLIRERRPWPRRAQAVCLRTLRWGLPQEEGASPPSPRRRVSEPYRLECVDTFSNILYVKESKRELSSLAHACVQVDKYRPETCCVIGNYYSLKGEHEKAVTYFRRALKLNQPSSRWTVPSTLCERGAPRARLLPPRAPAAPRQSGAQPRQLGSLPRPQ